MCNSEIETTTRYQASPELVNIVISKVFSHPPTVKRSFCFIPTVHQLETSLCTSETATTAIKLHLTMLNSNTAKSINTSKHTKKTCDRKKSKEERRDSFPCFTHTRYNFCRTFYFLSARPLFEINQGERKASSFLNP